MKIIKRLHRKMFGFQCVMEDFFVTQFIDKIVDSGKLLRNWQFQAIFLKSSLIFMITKWRNTLAQKSKWKNCIQKINFVRSSKLQHSKCCYHLNFELKKWPFFKNLGYIGCKKFIMKKKCLSSRVFFRRMLRNFHFLPLDYQIIKFVPYFLGLNITVSIRPWIGDKSISHETLIIFYWKNNFIENVAEREFSFCIYSNKKTYLYIEKFDFIFLNQLSTYLYNSWPIKIDQSLPMRNTGKNIGEFIRKDSAAAIKKLLFLLDSIVTLLSVPLQLLKLTSLRKKGLLLSISTHNLFSKHIQPWSEIVKFISVTNFLEYKCFFPNL